MLVELQLTRERKGNDLPKLIVAHQLQGAKSHMNKKREAKSLPSFFPLMVMPFESLRLELTLLQST